MTNAKNMTYVLGSIGTSLRSLAPTFKEVPPLQALVINKATGLPGTGFAEFTPDSRSFRNAPLRVKRQIVDGLLARVFSYKYWPDVLHHFGVALPKPPDLDTLLPSTDRAVLGSTGEGAQHLAFKHYVAAHPELVGLPHSAVAVVDHCFPSSDTVDILFSTKRGYVAVEVKSSTSSDYDLLRGIFQCIKYQALLDAVVAVERWQADARTLLVLQSGLPLNLRRIANTLGVTVVERVGNDSRVRSGNES